MMGLVGHVRLVPIVVFATASLLALKAFGIFADGGEIFTPHPAWSTSTAEGSSGNATVQSAAANAASLAGQRLLAQAMRDDPDYTGSISGSNGAPSEQGATRGGEPSGAKIKLAENQPTENKPPGSQSSDNKSSDNKPPDGKPPNNNPTDSKSAADPPTPLEGEKIWPSAGQRAVLEALNQRRQELDARAHELDIRESLLKGAEKRIEARINELKEVEARINGASQKKDDVDAARLKGLVIMYENMKPKDAAKIFDRLDLKILVEVVGQINPRKMADILGQMSPEAAERLTMELASRSGSEKSAPADELPKIEGKPNGT